MRLPVLWEMLIRLASAPARLEWVDGYSPSCDPLCGKEGLSV